MSENKNERTTWGFVQAGLGVQTSAFCIAVLWFGLDEFQFGFLLLTSTYIFNWAAVPGWTINNALPAQALLVSGHAGRNIPTKKL